MCNGIRRLSVSGLLALAWLLYLGGPGRAQNAAEWPHLTNINMILADFQAEPWQLRMKAFRELVGGGGFDYRNPAVPKQEALFRANPDRADELKLALISLLSFENAKVEAGNKEFGRILEEFRKTISESEAGEAATEEARRTDKLLSEEYTEYYADLIGAVKALKDPRSVNALAGAMGTGGMAIGGVLEFGPQAMDAVLEKSQSPDLLVRAPAINVLGAMLTAQHSNKFDNASRQKIRARILQAADDESWSVRTSVARILAVIPPDAETIAVLQKLAGSDPAVLRGQGENGADRYPVRQAAEKALSQIGQRQ